MQKKWMLVLALCLMLLGVQAAMAEEWQIQTVDAADRIQLCDLPGLVANVTGQNGSFTLTVDKEKTDWSKVITFGATSDDMGLLYNIVPPAGAETKVLVFGSDMTDEQLLADLKTLAEDAKAEHKPAKGSESGDFWINYRHYVEAQKLLTFYEPYTMKVAVLWYDSNRKPMYAEKMNLRLNFTTPGSVNVEPLTIPARMVREQNEMERRGGIERQEENGKVTYQLDKNIVLEVGGTYLQTQIQVPKGTVQVKGVDESGNTCINSSPVQKWFDYAPDESAFTIYIPHKKGIYVYGGISSVRASYQFLDEDGKILDGSGKMDIYRICTNDSRICLSYLDDTTWQPIPRDRFTYDIERDGDKLEIIYQDGLAHIQTAQMGNVSEVDARLLPKAQKHYQVKAYEGAAYYQFYCFGTPDAFSEAAAKNNQTEFEMGFAGEAFVPVNGGTIELLVNGNNNVFWQISKSQNQVDMFTVAAETLTGRATLCAIRWYKQDRSVLKTEWFAENADEIVLLPNTYTYEDPGQIPGKLDGPAVIDGGSRGWKLHAEYRPQAGSHSYVIDLELRDNENNPVKNFDEIAGKDGIEFFLPYPQGLSFGMAFTYKITHYFDVNLLNSEAVAEMTAEKEGIRFRVKSLSPIELSWQENEQPEPAPGPAPKTGDSVPLVLWFSLCVASLAAVAFIIFKKQKA